MSKLHLLLFISFSLSLSSMVDAQKNILLSGYTYSPSKEEVATITVSGNTIVPEQLEVAGRDADYFFIKSNKLLLKTDRTPVKDILEIEIRYRNNNEGLIDSFKIVKDEFIINKVIAHRGAWKGSGVPENSIAALQHAVLLGCAGSEFDVFMSADSVLYINHDPKIQGINIETASSSELKGVYLSNKEPLPTLESYLNEGLKQNKTRLILEIKPSTIGKTRSLASAKKIVELVRKMKAQGWVDYISFDYDILLKIKELDPNAKVAYLNGEKSPEEIKKDNLYGIDYHFSVLKRNDNWIPRAHSLGLTINVWTVNDDKMMNWLIEQNVDFITTNEPEKLLEKVKKK